MYPLRAQKSPLATPPPGEFKKRVLRVLEKGGLNVADLAIWLDRSYAVIYSWITVDKEPRRDARHRLTEHRLKLLERWIALRKPGLPVPSSIPQQHRAAHVEKVLENAKRDFARRAIQGDRGRTGRRRD